jgi:hypothetical protein
MSAKFAKLEAEIIELKVRGFDRVEIKNRVLKNHDTTLNNINYYLIKHDVKSSQDKKSFDHDLPKRKKVITTCNMPGCDEKFLTEVDKNGCRIKRRCPKCDGRLANPNAHLNKYVKIKSAKLHYLD